MIKPMVHNMFNNIQPNINTIMQMQGKFDEVKNHMAILKGTVCLVESLAKNVSLLNIYINKNAEQMRH